MSTRRTWTISLPAELARAAERAAREERLTRSAFVREALRAYLRDRRWRELQKQTAARARQLGIRTEEDVDRLVHEVRQ